jgi:hypothetical protein
MPFELTQHANDLATIFARTLHHRINGRFTTHAGLISGELEEGLQCRASTD